MSAARRAQRAAEKREQSPASKKHIRHMAGCPQCKNYALARVVAPDAANQPCARGLKLLIEAGVVQNAERNAASAAKDET